MPGNVSQAEAVASFIVPGEEDPAKYLKSGRYTMKWGSTTVTKFREVKVEKKIDEGYGLPPLYLHFLAPEFRVDKDLGEGHVLDQSLRAGNDMSEVVIKLPAMYFDSGFSEQCGSYGDEVKKVINALRPLGELFINKSKADSGQVEPGTRFYSLKCSRAKADVNLDKKAFGMPETAEQFLFVNNHASVSELDAATREAFVTCIDNLAEVEIAKKFHIFLKVFYEGGFGYNKKVQMSGCYLPINVGTAAMNTVEAFPGQVGIGTGYPYELPGQFLSFTETVPVSIEAIRQMSDRHSRYGLAFTRLVHVWEGDLWQSEQTLDFCSILPHGGFYYVPETLLGHQSKGGLVYAFGESKDDAAATELSQG